MKSLLSVLLVSAGMAATPAFAASDVVTIYSADGLHDGKGSWFETQFDAFTKATGIKVQYVEARLRRRRRARRQGEVEPAGRRSRHPAAVHPARRGRRPAAEVHARRRGRDPPAAGPERSYQRAGQQLPQLHLRLRRAQDRRRPPSTTCSKPEVQGQDPVFDPRPGRRRHRGHAAGDPCLRQQGRRLRLPEEAAGQQRRPVRLDRQADGAGQQGRALCRQRRRADEHVADGRRSEHPRVLAGGAGRRALRAAAALLRRPGRRRARRGQRQEADRLPALQGSPGDRLLGCDRRAGAQGRHADRRQLQAVFRTP